MNYDKLKDKAGLIILQHLLEKSKNEKFPDMQTLAYDAWQCADDFVRERPSRCSRCPYTLSDEIVKAAKADGALSKTGAGPKKDNKPAKSERRK